jgi:hypothetical protein
MYIGKNQFLNYSPPQSGSLNFRDLRFPKITSINKMDKHLLLRKKRSEK